MTIEHVERPTDRYGNAFLLSDAPDHQLPESGMPAADAIRLLAEGAVLDGIPMRGGDVHVVWEKFCRANSVRPADDKLRAFAPSRSRAVSPRG